VADRADLVVIGGGTVGGWASVFARAAGAGRVVVVERGQVGGGASSRAAGIVRAQGGTPATVALGRWSVDFYNGQQAAYGTDSGFREHGYLILAVTEDDETAGRERVAMQRAEGLDVTWLDAAAAARTAVTLAAHGHRGGSYLATDGAIDPPRNVRAYSLAMQAAAVELRERTTFTGLRTAPITGGGARVTAVETDAGAIETDRVLLTGGPSLRAVGRLAGVRIPVGAARHTVAVLEPHPAFDVARLPMVFDIGAGLYWRPEERGLLVGWSDPDEAPGEARSIDWAFYDAMRARLGGLVPVTLDLGLRKIWVATIARPPADPRARAGSSWRSDRGRDRRLAGRPRDDVGPWGRAGRGRPCRDRADRSGGRVRPRPGPVRRRGPQPPGRRPDRAAVPGQRRRRGPVHGFVSRASWRAPARGDPRSRSDARHAGTRQDFESDRRKMTFSRGPNTCFRSDS
jgi:sarcosine oxidase subunit beta